MWIEQIAVWRLQRASRPKVEPDHVRPEDELNYPLLKPTLITDLVIKEISSNL